MPILKEEFEKGRTQDTIKARIKKLLEDGRAYTLFEMGDYLFGRPRDLRNAVLRLVEMLVIRQALEDLMREGVIEAREVETRTGKETYYALKRRTL